MRAWAGDGHEMRHLLWLVGRRFRNRLVRMARQLKNPRYLAAVLVGVAYFVVVFFPMRADAEMQVLRGSSAAARDLLAIGVALWLLFWWLRGGYQQALAFAPEEVHQLFPAPLRRTSLVRYKLVNAQAGVLSTTLLLWIFGGAGALPWYLALPTLWVLIETLHLHQVGASLVRVTARHGAGGARRVAAPLILIVAVATAIVWTAASAFAALRAASDPGDAVAAAAAALDGPVPSIALAPFRALLAPVTASTVADWLRALPVALLLLAAHYAWVVRVDAAFEEAAAEAGRRRAEARAALRRGRGWWKLRSSDEAEARRWLRLPLGATGEPAVAVVWKHVLAFTGELTPVTLLLLGGGAVAVAGVTAVVSGSVQAAALAVAMMAALFAGLTLFLGPLVTRLDLRRDLEHLELLRTYPIESRWLVMAQLAAPVLVLTAAYTLLLLLGLAATPAIGAPPDVLRIVLVVFLVAAAVGPVLVTLQVAIQNLITLLFPDWVRIGPGAPTGIDGMGQGILLFLGSALLFLALLLPPVVLATLVGASFAPALSQWAVVPAGMSLLGGLIAEISLLVRGLVRLYERLDPIAAGLLH